MSAVVRDLDAKALLDRFAEEVAGMTSCQVCGAPAEAATLRHPFGHGWGWQGSVASELHALVVAGLQAREAAQA